MKKIFVSFCVLILCVGCSNNEMIFTVPETPNKSNDTSTINMFMVGDALLHGAVYHQAKNENDEYDFEAMLKRLEPITSEYDLNFYNQETILGGTELGLSTYPRFNSPQEFGDTMVKYGFNLVSLANNHTLDRGEEAILRSYEYWQNHEQVMTAGSYVSWEHRDEIDIREINGISYTLLAYTYGANGLVAPSGKEHLVNIYTKEMLEEDIKKVRNQVDLLLVSMHWGSEYTHTPTTTQVEMAEFLADLDVDIVIGHHPHVIQPVTWIDDTLVYYSLGNLISAQDGIPRTVGLMGAVKIEKTTAKGKDIIKIKNPKADLIFTYYDESYQNLHLKTFDELDESYQEIYDDYIQVIKEGNDDIIIGGIY